MSSVNYFDKRRVYGMPSYYPPSPPNYIRLSCGVCGDNFPTTVDRVTGKPEAYLCVDCKDKLDKDPLVEGVELNQEVDELLQEAEDHFNGVVRPKKIKETPLEELDRAPWASKPSEEFKTVQDAIDQFEQDRQDSFSNMNQRPQPQSQSQDQKPKKNHDWWKIFGIILITAVVTAFFTTLFHVL